MMEVYRDLGKKNGHLTRFGRNQVIDFKIKALSEFLSVLGQKEKELIEQKYRGVPKFHPDPLIVQNLDENKQLDLEKFKQEYYQKNFHETIDVRRLVSTYLDGMHWVLNYYVHSMPDWMWYFPYLYAPFLSDFESVMTNYKCPRFDTHSHVPPFLQLMVVLPCSSADLLPDELSTLMTSTTSPLVSYYPKDFEVDMAGKKQDWEGIVLLPPISIDDFIECYKREVRNVPPNILKRNMVGKSFVYKYNSTLEKQFVSFYGNIDKCSVQCSPIQL
jgi:5'-3' exonuclease